MKEVAKGLGVDVFFREGALGGLGQSPPLTKDRALAAQWLSTSEEFRRTYDYFDDKPYIQEGACSYLWEVATIGWDGSVLPCCWIFEYEQRFGNIMEEDFRSIWNNELFQSARSLFATRGKSVPKGDGPDKVICCQCKMFKHHLNG